MSMIEDWAARQRQRIGPYNPWLLGLGAVRRFNRVRVPGLAAEISYYGLISLMPLIITLGASLGFLERLLGAEQVRQIEATVLGGLGTVFGPELASTLAPLVRGLLQEEFAGVALISLFFTVFLASAGFRALIRALDDVYAVPERRAGPKVWLLAYLLAVVSVVVVSLLLVFLVVGPLLGGGARLADWFNLGRPVALAWEFGRWPLVLLLAAAYLGWLYRAGANLRNRWRDSLPGAITATVALVVIALGLRFYLGLAGPQTPAVGDAPRSVQAAAETVGAILAVALWLWASAIAVLGGAVLNAELRLAAARAGKQPAAIHAPVLEPRSSTS